MKRDEKAWLKQLRALSEEQQELLFAFTDFLAARGAKTIAPPGLPLNIPRPPQEKVIHAIKRLRANYPMLDESALLNEVSEHLTAHLMLGRAAPEVIDDLESLFREHYEKYTQEHASALPPTAL